MTQRELESYLWGAANILRGMIDAADFKQYIFPLLFFKRIVSTSLAVGFILVSNIFQQNYSHKLYSCKIYY